MSCQFEFNDRPSDEWCMFYFLRLARVGLQSEKIVSWQTKQRMPRLFDLLARAVSPRCLGGDLYIM